MAFSIFITLVPVKYSHVTSDLTIEVTVGDVTEVAVAGDATNKNYQLKH